MSGSPKATGELVDIGTVAAANIGKAINAHPDAIPVIKKAIVDEINALSSHFTLAFADVQTQYEAAVYQAKLAYDKELTQIKSVYNFARANVVALVGSAVVLLLVGAVIGHYV